MVTGKTTRPTGMVSTATQMEPGTKVTGVKTNNTEEAWKHGLMVLAMKVTMWRERNTDRETSHGLMAALTVDNSQKITLMVMVINNHIYGALQVFINGLMEENTKENGKTTKWKVAESLPGPITGDMRENISMTKKRVKECSIGQMGGSTRESGKTENNMVPEYIHQQVERPERGNGQTEREWLGSDIINKQLSLFLQFSYNNMQLMYDLINLIKCIQTNYHAKVFLVMMKQKSSNEISSPLEAALSSISLSSSVLMVSPSSLATLLKL